MSTPYRKAEFPLWFDHEWSAGEELKEICWPLNSRDRTIDVFTVSWEIFITEKTDLEDLLWYGELYWDFVQTTMPIGPLSMFHGSFGDLFRGMRGERSELEQLASLHGEGEWRELVQSFLLGQGLLYRGQQHHQDTHVFIPAWETAYVGLKFSRPEPLVPQGRVRVRVNLHGVHRQALNIP